MSVQARNKSDDAAVTAVTFSPGTGGANALSFQYLEVTYASDETNWGVNIWTNYGGTNPTADDNMGGLHKDFTLDTPKVSMMWQAFDDTAAYAGSSQTGVPANGSDPDWTFVKSKQDGNWTATQSGYAKVVDGDLGTIQGPTGGAATSPIVVYFAALFGSENTPAGNYAATLGCDLYHE